MPICTEDILKNHHKLCDDIYQILLEENAYLKKTGNHPKEELMQKKENLLSRLDVSLADIKKIGTDPAIGNEVFQEKIQVVQNKIMKIFYLMKENEQLLFKSALSRRSVSESNASEKKTSKLTELYTH